MILPISFVCSILKTDSTKGRIYMKQFSITGAQLSDWSGAYQASAERQLATLALSKTAINDVMFVPQAAFKMRQKFSVEIPTLEVTNQEASGRCWLFAATNVLREKICERSESGIVRAFAELSGVLGQIRARELFSRIDPHDGGSSDGRSRSELHSRDGRTRRRSVGYVQTSFANTVWFRRMRSARRSSPRTRRA